MSEICGYFLLGGKIGRVKAREIWNLFSLAKLSLRKLPVRKLTKQLRGREHFCQKCVSLNGNNWNSAGSQESEGMLNILRWILLEQVGLNISSCFAETRSGTGLVPRVTGTSKSGNPHCGPQMTVAQYDCLMMCWGDWLGDWGLGCTLEAGTTRFQAPPRLEPQLWWPVPTENASRGKVVDKFQNGIGWGGMLWTPQLTV